MGFEQLRGLDGVPYEQISLVRLGADGSIWLGSEMGAMRWESGQWHMYNGKRWFPSNTVTAILTLEDHTTYVGTDQGLGVIWREEWTLEQKAHHFEAVIAERHDRFGFVSSCTLDAPGDVSKWKVDTQDNDGLWTSIYAIAKIFEYATTKDEAARERAWRAVSAMLDMTRKCPIPGYPARALIKRGEYPDLTEDHPRYQASTDPDWLWRNDTSSDETDGHYWVYGLYYDLCATEDEKAEIAEVSKAIMDHLIEHDFTLVDENGRHTTWGVWTPMMMNGVPHRAQRGLNSLELLAYLLVTHHVTGEQKYRDIYLDLVENHHFHLNTIRQKLESPEWNNHSDDELAYTVYHVLMLYETDPGLKRIYDLSFERSQRYEWDEFCPFTNFIYGGVTGRPCDEWESVKTLMEMPTSFITWEVDNRFRHDLDIIPEGEGLDGKGEGPLSRNAIPADERHLFRWNGGPYRLHHGGNGQQECDPSSWLCAYWMGRYYELTLGY
jgi:hypothetical protein